MNETPAHDFYANRFSEIVGFVPSGPRDFAFNALSTIAIVGAKAFVGGTGLRAPKNVADGKRTSIPIPVMFEVYNRDSWICRYCGTRTVLLPLLNLLSDLFPDVFHFHPHWKTDETDVSFALVGTSCDHGVPHAGRGTGEIDNLVTACWRCNAIKSNHSLESLGWQLRPIRSSVWDGLSGNLEHLARTTGQTTKYSTWIRAINGHTAL